MTGLKPTQSEFLEIVHAQLDALDEARTVADELIEALLFNAVEAGVSIRSLIDAWGRRFGPGTCREWARDIRWARVCTEAHASPPIAKEQGEGAQTAV